MSNRPDNAFPFEPLDEQGFAQTRRDPSDTPEVSGYESTDGDVLPATGDKTAPFTWMLGRAISDPSVAAPAVTRPVGDNEPQKVLLDAYGRVAVVLSSGSVPAAVLTTPNPIANATSNVYSVAASAAGDATGRRIVKASGGRLRRAIFVNNDPANTLYAQVHNAAVLANIATGTLVWPGIPVPANGGVVEVDFSEADLPLTTGIGLALSTVQGTYTAVAVTGFTAAQYA